MKDVCLVFTSFTKTVLWTGKWDFLTHIGDIGRLREKTVPTAADCSRGTFITDFQGVCLSFCFEGRKFQYIFILQVLKIICSKLLCPNSHLIMNLWSDNSVNQNMWKNTEIADLSVLYKLLISSSFSNV